MVNEVKRRLQVVQLDEDFKGLVLVTLFYNRRQELQHGLVLAAKLLDELWDLKMTLRNLSTHETNT